MWFSMAFHGQRLVYQQLFCGPTTTAWDLCFSHGSGSASWEIRDLAEDRSTASHCGPKSGISMDLTWPNQANLGVWWCVCHGFMVFLRSCFFANKNEGWLSHSLKDIRPRFPHFGWMLESVQEWASLECSNLGSIIPKYPNYVFLSQQSLGIEWFWHVASKNELLDLTREYQG